MSRRIREVDVLWFGDERGYNATIITWRIIHAELWFGDERGYNATHVVCAASVCQLWFGDERGYNATCAQRQLQGGQLWFGDERGYNATRPNTAIPFVCCGLVMKEDITQQKFFQHQH